MRFLVLFFSFAMSTSVAAMSLDELLEPDKLSYSWVKAVVYMPESMFPKTVEILSQPSKHPVLIYLHGCAGLNDDSREWGRFIKNLGFIVIQPDSFAIPDRKSNCDPRTQTPMLLKDFDTFKLRNRELLQARNELRKLDWLDQKRIFLMGHSEGGMTVSRTGIDSFRGVIASGYWCHQGLVVKHATAPFLFLNWREDPWFMGRAASRNPTICQQHADQRPATTQVLLDGRGHATSGSPEAKEAVERFLKAALTE
jgi:dienelactone hydrolase